MLDENARGDGREPKPQIVLAGIGQAFWLIEGEEFLGAMLSGQGSFPTPVICLRCEDAVELQLLIGPDVLLGELWGINPDIIARLERDGHIEDRRDHRGP